jgi:hypothetical protein
MLCSHSLPVHPSYLSTNIIAKSHSKFQTKPGSYWAPIFFSQHRADDTATYCVSHTSPKSTPDIYPNQSTHSHTFYKSAYYPRTLHGISNIFPIISPQCTPESVSYQ